MSARKPPMLALAALALGLTLTACGNSGTQPDQGTGEKCTDQVDYAGDPRSNAEINSIGEDTGTCPPVQDK